jgi:hypothetical protein
MAHQEDSSCDKYEVCGVYKMEKAKLAHHSWSNIYFDINIDEFTNSIV